MAEAAATDGRWHHKSHKQAIATDWWRADHGMSIDTGRWSLSTSQLLAITTATPPINHVYHCRRLPDDVAVDSLVLNEDVHGQCHMDHQSHHSVCKHTDISSPLALESNLEENFPSVICSLAEPNGCLALILIMRIPSLPPLSMARTPYKSHYQLTVGRTWQFHSHLLMGRTLSSLYILSSQRWAVLGWSSRSTPWGESHGSPRIFSSSGDQNVMVPFLTTQWPELESLILLNSDGEQGIYGQTNSWHTYYQCKYTGMCNYIRCVFMPWWVEAYLVMCLCLSVFLSVCPMCICISCLFLCNG